MRRISLLVLMLLMLLTANVRAEVYFTDETVQAALFPGDTFVEQPLNIDRAMLKTLRKATSATLLTDPLKVWRVEQQGSLQGWLFRAEVLGKHENIRYALAIDDHGSITGLEIMEYHETHGGEVKNAAWRERLYAKNLNNSRFKLGQDVDNITGATLSCRHLSDGIHALLLVHQQLLQDSSPRQ